MSGLGTAYGNKEWKQALALADVLQETMNGLGTDYGNEELSQALAIADVFAQRGIGYGSGSGSGGIRTTKVSFGYGSTSPVAIRTSSQLRIVSACLLVVTPFDDPAATATVGDDTVPDRLLNAHSNSLTVAELYEAAPYYLYPTPTDIKLYLNPGTSTQGSGIIFLYEV